MPKAGTGWLFDQLQFHPDFWMAPLKGLHYLDRDVPTIMNAVRTLKRMERKPDRPRPGRRAGDERDLAFLREAASLSGQPRDLRRYTELFRYKGDLLSGDITAPYAGVKEEVVAEVANVMSNVKIVLLVRDPVARAWSNVSMAYRGGRFDKNWLDDPDKFMDYFLGSPINRFSFATAIAERWARAAPNVQFRHFFFDDIDKEPQKARAEILRYLGADPEKKSGEIPPSHNRKATAEKLELNDNIKRILVEHFSDELRAGADLFGGHAREWPTRYGL